MSEIKPTQQSPRWSSTTKLVVGITIVGIVAAMLVRFRIIIGPIILAFVIAYLLYPVAEKLSSSTRMPWRTAVNLIYVLVVILVGGSITVAGFAIVQQVQSLVSFVQRFVTQLPGLVADLSGQQFTLGPFTINPDEILNLQNLTNQVLAVVQPILGQLGVLLRSFAGSAAVTLGWGFFTLVVSYFLLSEAGKVPDELVHIELPGYDNDLQRLGLELRKTWNAFLRGQLIITGLIAVSYTLLMVILGVRFAVSIGLVAGLARFIPYLGQVVTIIVIALVSFFQEGNYFGLDPMQYVLVVIIVTTLVDQVVDSLFTPRFLGHALGVHPAAVLVRGDSRRKSDRDHRPNPCRSCAGDAQCISALCDPKDVRFRAFPG